jgi:AraC family transcriptional regulator
MTLQSSLPDQLADFLGEHIIRALRAHLARHQAPAKPRRGGLSPRHERLAKELLLASIQDGAAAADIARILGLSRAHFIRAFRVSTGETPHRWLTARKMEQARKLLAESDQPLSDIALTCGFSDQSHFTRVFSRFSGTPPGAWRRYHTE